MIDQIDSRKAEQLSIGEAQEALDSSMQGLAAAEVQRRLTSFGPNVLEEKRSVHGYAYWAISGGRSRG